MDYADPRVKQGIEVLQSFLGVARAATEFTRRNAESLGLTMLGMSIVNTVSLSPGLTLKELAERLQSSKSTVSVNVEALVRAGIAVRKAANGNRREINLELTVEGEELARRSIRQAYSYRAMTAAIAEMDQTQIEALLAIHGRIREGLTNYRIEPENA